jgi:restriction system protein
MLATPFQTLGFVNVKVGPPGADEGIDVAMQQKTDVGTVHYIVECKHHSEGTIGRPVVQKLHSAVMYTSDADKGIIVTSGYFSSEAIQYAEEVGIELIDLDKLKELAKKAGMLVQRETSLLIENCFPISEKSAVIGKLYCFLEKDVVNFQKEIMRVEEIGLRLFPSYMIDYSINAMFSTSAGLIHSINEKSSVFLDGENGELINPIITTPLLSLKYSVSQLDEEAVKGVKLLGKREFKKDFKEVRENAREALRKLYTKMVSYYGANNVHYSKTCVPNKKDITILEAKRVYLPIWSLEFSILKNKYLVVATESLNELNVLPSELASVQSSSDVKVYPDKCMICSNDFKSEKHICKECGIITCNKDSSKCKVCGKVICREHTVSRRRLLILSDKYCPQCAKSKGFVS